MKKIAYFGSILLVAILVASCKKDHTCTCSNGANTKAIVYPNSTQSNAQIQCQRENPYADSSGVKGYQCVVTPE